MPLRAMAFYPLPFLTAIDPKPLAENMQSRGRQASELVRKPPHDDRDRHAEAGKLRRQPVSAALVGQRLLIPPSMMSSLPTI